MCAECAREARELREKRDGEARRKLDAGSAKKGFPGRWPCAISLCEREGEPDSVWHDSADMELWHISQAQKFRITIKGIKGTDRSPVCRPCSERVSRAALMVWGLDYD
jgi:hypothetical protein